MNAPYRVESFYTDVGPFHVVNIGGGIGGLTLAHGLRKAGVSVAVYERDRTTTSRVQGYRVHINPTGSRAPARLPAAASVRGQLGLDDEPCFA